MFLRSRASRSRGPMPLDTFARLAAALPSSRSGLRIFGAMKCRDYTEADSWIRSTRVLFIDTVHFLVSCSMTGPSTQRRTYNAEIAEHAEKPIGIFFSVISAI